MRELEIMGGKLLYTNFSGEAFGKGGNRDFCVIIDKDLADELDADGWNVHVRESNKDPQDVTFYLKVNISYRFFTPAIWRVCGPNPEDISPVPEEGLNEFDQKRAQIDYVDCKVTRGKIDPKTGKSGNPYLDEAYIVLRPSRLGAKWGR